MRIALLAPDCHKRDGQARYVCELAERLAGRGHEVDVWSQGFAGTAAPGLVHRPLRTPFRRSVRLRHFALARAASGGLADGRYDVRHTVGVPLRKAEVWTVQFCQAAWREFAASGEWRGARAGPIHAWLDRRIENAERAVLSSPARSARVIAVSRRVAGDIARHYGRADGVTVIPNGVDVDRFHPARREDRDAVRAALGVQPGAFLIAFLGEFERKNLATAIAALARLPARAVLVACGPSPPARYRAQAARLGIAGHRLLLLPPTGEPEKLLAAADAFAFPTLYEPFGMAPLEAAASATPIVVSRRAGFAEWVEDGRNGLLLDDPTDAAALAGRLARLEADPALAAGLAAGARRLAEGFSWQAVVEATEAVYREAAQARPALPAPA